MLNKRLMALASLVSKGASVLDVGTDHAYLPIYLLKEKICSKAIGSDISKGALSIAKKNAQKYNSNVKLVLSDGLNNIEDDYDTLIISGMGTKTIIDILDNKDLVSKIILSSNNNLFGLRRYMNKRGYYIKKEIVVFESNKYYDIILYEKGREKLKKKELLYGKSHDKKYYTYLYQKNKELLKKVNVKKKIILLNELFLLKRYMEII